MRADGYTQFKERDDCQTWELAGPRGTELQASRGLLIAEQFQASLDRESGESLSRISFPGLLLWYESHPQTGLNGDGRTCGENQRDWPLDYALVVGDKFHLVSLGVVKIHRAPVDFPVPLFAQP